MTGTHPTNVEIDEQFATHSDVLTNNIQRALTLAAKKQCLDDITVVPENEHGETVIKAVGDIIPHELRQEVNLGNLSLNTQESEMCDGSCRTHAEFEVKNEPSHRRR